MPLYEFDCNSCREVVEVLVRNTDQKVECPDCGADDLTRLMSAPATPSISTGNKALPVAPQGEGCGAPRCCGGGCDL